MLNEKSYKSENIDSWDRLLQIYNELTRAGDQWIFRGQRNSEWHLKTSLERAMKNSEIEMKDALKLEGGLLRRFKRQYHHYAGSTPKDDNIIEWFALMRHYGAPTRLLDWTYSFFVALYFALEGAGSEYAAVWAFNTDWMIEKVKPILGNDIWKCFKDDETVTKFATFKKVLAREEPIAMVLAINPYKLNERLVIQQGIFLCPGDVSKPFEDNLAPLLSESDSQNGLIKYKIKSDKATRREILQGLHRMNINRATLFPGLEGFAQSLETLFLVFPDILKPDLDFMP